MIHPYQIYDALPAGTCCKAERGARNTGSPFDVSRVEPATVGAFVNDEHHAHIRLVVLIDEHERGLADVIRTPATISASIAPLGIVLCTDPELRHGRAGGHPRFASTSDRGVG